MLTESDERARARRAARASAVRSAQRPSGRIWPGRLGERDEGGGRQLAAQRVPPAQQRLDAADPAVAQVDVGLVDEVHLAVVDGAGEVELEPALARSATASSAGSCSAKRARPSILARRSAVSACIEQRARVGVVGRAWPATMPMLACITDGAAVEDERLADRLEQPAREARAVRAGVAGARR